MIAPRLTLRITIAMLAVAGLSACAAASRHAPQAPEVALSATTAFRLQPLTPSAAGCSVQKAVLQLSAVRGDTMYFSAATPTKWPTGAPQCPLTGPGYVVTSAHSELRAERMRRPSLAERVLSVPYALAVGLGIIVVVAVSGAQ